MTVHEVVHACRTVKKLLHGHTVMVTYPYAYMTYIMSPLAGLGCLASCPRVHLSEVPIVV